MNAICLLLLAATTAGEWTESQRARQFVPDSAPAVSASLDAREVDRRLLALELAVSEIVVQRPEIWRFDHLQQEAAALSTAASDQRQRAEAAALAARIDRFASIANGFRRQQIAANTPQASRVAPVVARTKAAPLGDESRHDAVGVLRPVVSARADAPKYGVVDNEGRLRALVTPSPAVAAQFDELLGKPVALEGTRGYLTDLKREHLVAERITPLGTLRR